MRPETKERERLGALLWAQAAAPTALRSPSIPLSHPTTRFEFALVGDASADPPFATRSKRVPGLGKRAVALLGLIPPSTTMNP